MLVVFPLGLPVFIQRFSRLLHFDYIEFEPNLIVVLIVVLIYHLIVNRYIPRKPLLLHQLINQKDFLNLIIRKHNLNNTVHPLIIDPLKNHALTAFRYRLNRVVTVLLDKMLEIMVLFFNFLQSFIVPGLSNGLLFRFANFQRFNQFNLLYDLRVLLLLFEADFLVV